MTTLEHHNSTTVIASALPSPPPGRDEPDQFLDDINAESAIALAGHNAIVRDAARSRADVAQTVLGVDVSSGSWTRLESSTPWLPSAPESPPSATVRRPRTRENVPGAFRGLLPIVGPGEPERARDHLVRKV